MCCSGQEQDHDQRRVQPVEQERQERQLENVEPDIGTELGIGDAELAGIAEQQPVLPQSHRRERQQQCEQQGDAVTHHTETLAEQLVEPLDVRMHIGRELRRCSPVGDQQVEPGDHDECHE